MLTTWHMHVNTLICITMCSTESWLSSLWVTGIAAGRVEWEDLWYPKSPSVQPLCIILWLIPPKSVKVTILIDFYYTICSMSLAIFLQFCGFTVVCLFCILWPRLLLIFISYEIFCAYVWYALLNISSLLTYLPVKLQRLPIIVTEHWARSWSWCIKYFLLTYLLTYQYYDESGDCRMYVSLL